ncbi:MAG: hypothetical protein KGI33_07695 [Thaumarchaeota archaeon]|nr:hypothetical protein [Nitrososphaerota archaeon]
MRRIDWNTVNRVMGALYGNARMKRTTLATTCSMGYDKCCLYVDWLVMMELVSKERGEEGYEELALTEKGRLIYGKTSKIEKFCGGCIENMEDF